LPDIVKAEFQKHIAMHEQALQAQQIMQQQMQQAQGEAPQQQSAVEAPAQSGMTDQQLG